MIMHVILKATAALSLLLIPSVTASAAEPSGREPGNANQDLRGCPNPVELAT
jgi:hypothetical protein